VYTTDQLEVEGAVWTGLGWCGELGPWLGLSAYFITTPSTTTTTTSSSSSWAVTEAN